MLLVSTEVGRLGREWLRQTLGVGERSWLSPKWHRWLEGTLVASCEGTITMYSHHRSVLKLGVTYICDFKFYSEAY